MALVYIALYSSKAERRVSGGVGGWCAQSFSCQTQLSLNCVRLFWSCFGVVVGVLTISVHISFAGT